MMMQTCYKTVTMLRKDVHQWRNMLQQQTIMRRWCYNKLSWCILMCNIMFRCYNTVSMYLMMFQCTIMLTNDKQCYITLQHSYNGVTMMRNLLLRCNNKVSLYNNAKTSYNNVQLCYKDVHLCIMLCNTMLQCASMLQHSYDDVEHVLLCRNNVVTMYYNGSLQLHKRTILH